MTGQGMGVTALNALAMSTTSYPGSLPPTLHPPATAPAPITSTTTASTTMGATQHYTTHDHHAHAAAAAAHQAHGEITLPAFHLCRQNLLITMLLNVASFHKTKLVDAAFSYRSPIQQVKQVRGPGQHS